MVQYGNWQFAKYYDNIQPVLREKFQELTGELKDQVIGFYGERLISLAIFGSVAAETMRPDSDIDIFICAENLPRGRWARLKEFLLMEEALTPALDSLKKSGIFASLSPIIKTPSETEAGSLLFIDMTENVKILYDKNSFLRNYLDKLKNKLQELGSKKYQIGNAWYWDLIPNFKQVKGVSF